MKVLIGVCGIGMGHVSRQLLVAQELSARGHDVRFMAYGQALPILIQQYSKKVVNSIYVPWVACDARGLRPIESFRKSWRGLAAGLLRNHSVRQQLVRDGFKPDICVSDMEPVTARVAYKHKVPLITIDQQSKFLGFQLPPLGERKRDEERTRLSIFFPRADARLATSFYNIDADPDPEFRVELYPPIVRITPDHRTAETKSIVVYLSRYGADSFVPMSPLVTQMSNHPDWQFTIFSNDPAPTASLPQNVEIRKTDRDVFVDRMRSAQGVITTGGHTLLSECALLRKPVLVFPLATYDQHVCGYMINKASIGINVGSEYGFVPRHLTEFLDRIPEFKSSFEGNQTLIMPTAYGVKPLVQRIEQGW